MVVNEVMKIDRNLKINPFIKVHPKISEYKRREGKLFIVQKYHAAFHTVLLSLLELNVFWILKIDRDWGNARFTVFEADILNGLKGFDVEVKLNLAIDRVDFYPYWDEFILI